MGAGAAAGLEAAVGQGASLGWAVGPGAARREPEAGWEDRSGCADRPRSARAPLGWLPAFAGDWSEQAGRWYSPPSAPQRCGCRVLLLIGIITEPVGCLVRVATVDRRELPSMSLCIALFHNLDRTL